MATILIVDDDEALLKMLQISLGKAHYDVRTALDGDEALRQLKQGGVDLMVTDVVMPGKEGVELMLQLRATMPELRIIAMSGGGGIGAKTYLDIARSIGAVDTLQKPFSISTLVNKVKCALEGSGRGDGHSRRGATEGWASAHSRG